MGRDGGGVWNFGWVEQGHLAGMAWPDAQAWATLASWGLKAVLTLTPEPPPGDPVAHGLAWRTLPIEDFGVPDADDLAAAVAWVRAAIAAGRPVVVHCRAGVGRTGLVLAAVLAAGGLPAAQAIARVRRLRPGSIETAQQEEVVERMAARGGRRSPSAPDEAEAAS